ncbi:DUF4178 domain-containing protein [Streptomyces sp. ISL-66]|uniref:DUF4178 domain-containing protein n=1 Tax=Streptomyces sp. ISL-66 TaxID=2819186 RepID=UPI001BE8CC98|nr:DUF4178 domain-containing protein [Streptomyces sp. ISL-66]MBT2468890.1 DUF4178 domain-containing protein [Streptomyces sp. ISL-66]
MAAADPPSIPAEHPLLRLRPGTRLWIAGTPHTVRTAVQVDGGTQRWAEYLLDGPRAGRWLAVEALPQGSVRLSRWVRTEAGPTGFDPERPAARGVPLVETERGEAEFTATGDLSALPGLPPAGRLRFVDYAGDGVHASLEWLGPGAPALLGTRTDVVPPAGLTIEAPPEDSELPELPDPVEPPDLKEETRA